MFEDAAFHERIREITFYGNPTVLVRLFDQAPIRPPRLTSIVYEQVPQLHYTSGPGRVYHSLPQTVRDRRLHLHLDFIPNTRNLTHLSLTIYRETFSGPGRICPVAAKPESRVFPHDQRVRG